MYLERKVEGTVRQASKVKSESYVGQRVLLEHLLFDGKYVGTIKDIDVLGHCLVKLDKQEKPVCSVLYYSSRPIVVNSSLWQFCYPLPEVTE